LTYRLTIMQKPILPIQITGASAGPARPKNGALDGGAQFSQTLNREIAQRKPQPAAPAASKQNGPPKQQASQTNQANQANQGDRANGANKAAEPARALKGKAEGKDGADESAAQSAAAQQPVVDMMALVASFNLPGSATAATDGAAPDALPGSAAAVAESQFAAAVETAGLDRLAAAGGELLDGAAAGQFNKLLVQVDENAGADPALQQQAGKAGPALPAGVPDPGQLTSVRVREAAPETLVKELAVAAPASAAVQQASLAHANAPAADKIAARVGTPAWDNQVGQKIVWMVAGKEQSATLTLNPPDMGPMQVVLSVTNDHASVTFSSATPEVRQALEDALPKLREMMSENGIALGNASVNDGAAQQQQQARDDGAARGPRTGERAAASGSAAEAEAKVAERPARRGELPGLVDTFA
jgi:flagellar hook-length control protein FliK